LDGFRPHAITDYPVDFTGRLHRLQCIVNFDAIYAQALKRKQEEASGEAKEEQTH